MKKLGFLLLLLSVGTFSFVGCAQEKPKPQGGPVVEEEETVVEEGEAPAPAAGEEKPAEGENKPEGN